MSLPYLNIPQELRDPFFFTEEKVEMDVPQITPYNPLFAYEIVYFNGGSLHSLPWLKQESFIREIVTSWRKEEEFLKMLFKNRSKETFDSMKRGIGQFYMFLYWSNGQPVKLESWESEVACFSVKPVNAVERLTFIRKNVSLFHSYIQLSQLFEEQNKQYAKFLALNQAPKK